MKMLMHDLEVGDRVEVHCAVSFPIGKPPIIEWVPLTISVIRPGLGPNDICFHFREWHPASNLGFYRDEEIGIRLRLNKNPPLTLYQNNGMICKDRV